MDLFLRPVRLPRQILMTARLDVKPNLIVIHGISLPPGQFGGPWIDQLFTNALDSDAHPYFREIVGYEGIGSPF